MAGRRGWMLCKAVGYWFGGPSLNRLDRIQQADRLGVDLGGGQTESYELRHHQRSRVSPKWRRKKQRTRVAGDLFGGGNEEGQSRSEGCEGCPPSLNARRMGGGGGQSGRIRVWSWCGARR